MARPYDSAFALSSLLQSAESFLFSARLRSLDNLDPDNSPAHLERSRETLRLIDEHLKAVREKLAEADAPAQLEEAA